MKKQSAFRFHLYQLFLCCLMAGPSYASLARDNEEGLSPTHSYTQLGEGENVSNLNGNLVVTLPVADVESSSPLGIHLERSYNSHWRDPLVTQQYDVLNMGGYAWREKPDFEYHNVDLDDGQKGDFGNIFQKITYSNKGTSVIGGNAATAIATGFAVSDGIYNVSALTANFAQWALHGVPSITEVPKASQLAGDYWAGDDAQNAATGSSISWAATTFAVSGLIVDGIILADHKGKWTQQEIINMAVGVPVAVAALGTIFLEEGGKQTAAQIIGPIAFGLSVYNFVQYEDKAEPWDPGYAANQYLMPISMALDATGTLLLFTPAMPAGVALIGLASVMQLGGKLASLIDVGDNRWDMADFYVKPWALSVNLFGSYSSKLASKLKSNT